MSDEALDIEKPEASAPIEAPVVAPETAAPEKTDKPKTLRETLVESVKIETEKAEAEEKRRGNPYKAADGKFTKKPLETKAPETAAAEVKESEAPETKVETAPQARVMPKSWAADKQALWDQAPQALKDLILSRENQVNEGFAKYQGIKPEVYKELDAVLAPLDPMIQGYGTTRPEFVRQLTNWHQALANNPQEAFPALARAYGFNLQGSPAADTALATNVVYDPRVDQVSQTVAQLQHQLAEQQRREQEAQLRQTSEHISKWASDTQNPKPHYEKVRQQMGLLIKSAAESGREMSLDEAYEQSIWANSEIREQLMKDRFTAEQKAAAEKARKSQLASVSVNGRAPSAPSNANGKPQELRSTIKDAFATYQGAGRT